MINTMVEHKIKVIVGCVLLVAFVAFLFLRGDGFDMQPGAWPQGPRVFRDGSYGAFLNDHAHVPRGTQVIPVDIRRIVSGHGYSFEYNVDASTPVALRTEEYSYVDFRVYVPAAGMYSLRIDYLPVPARGIDIVREVQVNGLVPFRGAEQVTFSRIWGDSPVGVREDNRGNQIRPPQIERPRWDSAYFRDRLGFFTSPYQFYFRAGYNTVRLVGVAEPLVIRSLELTPVAEPPTFAEFMQAGTAQHGSGDPNFMLRVQGEHSTVRSSPSLFAMFDSSSGVTDPPSASAVQLNMIGGQPWRIPGQWIEWEFEAPAAGLYHISLSTRQNYNRGFVSHRSLSVNGEIPFREVEAIPFQFNNSWELRTLADDEGNYLLFPMQAGTNRIRMEVTLGAMGEIIDRILDSVHRLNQVYLEILVLTGATPDPLRDYRVDYWLPDVMVALEAEIPVLHGIIHDMTIVIGDRNEHTGLISTLVRQIEDFVERPIRIPVRLFNFRQNLSALGDSARILTEGQLDVDFLYISGVNAQLPRVRETFFNRAAHEIRGFVASFFFDFDALGDIYDGDRVIEVWIQTGRDQANILGAMIDDSFVPESGIGVNLRLVSPAAVLPAVVARIGPDVALSLGLADPVNYAMRNAAVDLTQFPDFWEVTQRFHHSAMVPFEFQGRYYALPETQNFSLTFYRTDILEDLGLTPPRTWTDVLAMMPILQRNNMQMGIPPIGDPMAPDPSGFLTQLYQRGGFLYNEDNSRTILYREEAIAAFEAYTRFFTHMGSPQAYNFINRFRSGEMPIGFADFTTFNTLSVFAPEIDGMWNFALMPGYVHADGRIDHSVPTWGSAAVMFEQSENQEDAWEFMKWWTSAETQLRFAREMESVMGAAARFPTANLEAFSSLPWSTAELAILNEQREWGVGTPEVPGGYYMQRHLINATRRVINNNVDTRETLLDFVIVIDRELANKRREFGLE